MSWRNYEPNRRLWAIILVNGNKIPQMAQWEPKIRKWIIVNFQYEYIDSSECQWHPLPHHTSFSKEHIALT